MSYVTTQIDEIATLFEGELRLASKSVTALSIPDFIEIGRSTVERPPATSPGLELVYQSPVSRNPLTIYLVLCYKTNSAGRKYPHNLIIAADSEANRLGDVVEAYLETKVKPFLFVESPSDQMKRFRFERASELKEESPLRELTDLLNNPFFTM